jgi:hypothetical protein
MKNACDAAVKDALRQRIQTLSPAASAGWGRMNVHQVVCHLTDQMRDMLGIRPVQFVGNGFLRHVVRPAISLLPAWPKGKFPTAPAYDQLKGGTTPSVFERDRAELLELFGRLDIGDRSRALPPHPAFGKLTHRQYGRIVYQHFNHHLTQFGA